MSLGEREIQREREKERAHVWAWGSASIGVEGGGLGFHGFTIGEFKT